MFENLKRFSFRYLKCHNLTKPLDHGPGSYPLFFTPVVHFTVATFDLVQLSEGDFGIKFRNIVLIGIGRSFRVHKSVYFQDTIPSICDSNRLKLVLTTSRKNWSLKEIRLFLQYPISTKTSHQCASS